MRAESHADELLADHIWSAESPECRELVERHLPLVAQVVFQVAVNFPRHVDRDELASAGALGLVEAARRYDKSRKVPFDKFASRRVRGAILDAVRAVDFTTRAVRNGARRLEELEQQLASELGRAPDANEIADRMGMTREEVNHLRDRIFRSVVLAVDHVVADDIDGELTLTEVLEDPRAVEPSAELEHAEQLQFMRDAVNLLPEKQRIVITSYFYGERSSREIADLLGVTESRVSQIRTEALDALRRGISDQYSEERPSGGTRGRQERRRERFAADIAARSDWKERITVRISS